MTMQSKQYAGLDYFKIAAAMLVIAVHTSPLLSMNETADFMLTRIAARVAVPFFFMATAFFLLPRYLNGEVNWRGGMSRFLSKTGLLYAASIALFIPVNIYAGYFNDGHLAGKLLKDFAFDGTFYHLWYLPASMLGAVVVYTLARWSSKPAFLLGVTGALYIIGLFGDSYYGLLQGVPAAESVYGYLFLAFDYTRNGIFFAPVYIAMGALIGCQRKQPSIRTSTAGLAVSFALLMTEALLLHSFALQRHDSMYVMMLPVMYFLFQLLIVWKGAARPQLRTVSLLVYIIHPLWIIAVRGVAKLAGLEELLIDNSLIHYTAVAAGSLLSSAVIAKLYKPQRKQSILKHRAWAEVDLAHLRHNAAELQGLLPEGCRLMAVVKANAYGHGDVIVSKELNKIGVSSFAVATLSEGIHLRKNGINGEILVLSHTHPEDAAKLKRYKLMQTVGDYDYARMLNSQGMKIKVHIKMDTGMHRLGESYENVDKIVKIYRFERLEVEGIYTHLSRSDSLEEEDIRFTRSQIDHFYDTVDKLRKAVGDVGKTHIQSSYGVLNYPLLQCDYARVGIALYGALSHEHDQTLVKADLRPVLALKARVSTVKQIAAGETIGYGSGCAAACDMTIAVVSIGYADGIPRNLSGGIGSVLIHGEVAPIIGSVCMDQLMIDVTPIRGVGLGDIVTLIGQEGGKQITVEQVAARNGSIANDLLSRLGSRLERVS